MAAITRSSSAMTSISRAWLGSDANHLGSADDRQWAIVGVLRDYGEVVCGCGRFVRQPAQRRQSRPDPKLDAIPQTRLLPGPAPAAVAGGVVADLLTDGEVAHPPTVSAGPSSAYEESSARCLSYGDNGPRRSLDSLDEARPESPAAAVEAMRQKVT